AHSRLDATHQQASLTAPLVRSVLVGARRFNDSIDRWGSKSGILGSALRELVEAIRTIIPGRDELTIVIDKHGGRNYYTALLQEVFPDGFAVVEQEGQESSRYRILGMQQKVRCTF